MNTWQMNSTANQYKMICCRIANETSIHHFIVYVYGLSHKIMYNKIKITATWILKGILKNVATEYGTFVPSKFWDQPM